MVRSREGNRLANSAPLDNYPTGDGKYVCIVAGSDANFARLCSAMERPDLPTDARYDTLAKRAGLSDEINGVVADWTMTLSSDEVVERCVAADVPVATAFTAADLFADPHVAARGDLVTVDDPVAGPIRQQAPYPRRVGEVPDAPTGAPDPRPAHHRGPHRPRPRRRRAGPPRRRRDHLMLRTSCGGT